MSELAKSERMMVPEVRRAMMIAVHLAREDMENSARAEEFDKIMFGLENGSKQQPRNNTASTNTTITKKLNRNKKKKKTLNDLGMTTSSNSLHSLSTARSSSVHANQGCGSDDLTCSYKSSSLKTPNSSRSKRVRHKRHRGNNISITDYRPPWLPCSPIEVPSLQSPISPGSNRKSGRRKNGGISLASIASSSYNVYMSVSEKRASAAKQHEVTMAVYERVIEEQFKEHELDLTPQLPHLNDQILWELGVLFPKVTSIKLCGWNAVSVLGLRSIALGFGDQLKALDLSGAPLTDEMVKMLTTRFFHLENLVFKDCAMLSNSSCRMIVETCNASLTGLDLSRCSRISEDGLMWLAGQIGAQSIPCGKLRSLSLEDCTRIKDQGIIPFGKECRQLRFINLAGCTQVTDYGIEGLASGCHKLEVVNLAGVYLLSDKALLALGSSSSATLRSVNLARCVKITDLGLQAFANCHKFQALNVAGCAKISEAGIFFVIEHNKVMQILNVTGCELVTQQGLQGMLRGLEFGELAESYMGFKPKAGMTDLKIAAQMQLVFDDASHKISAAIRGHGTRLRLNHEKNLRISINAAGKLQRLWRGYLARDLYKRKVRRRHEKDAAQILQVWWAGRKGKMMRLVLRAKNAEDKRNSMYAVKFQAAYRGKVARAAYPEVRAAIQLLRDERWADKLEVVTVRMQARARGKLSQTMNRAQREELQQRVTDMNHAAVVIQSLVRGRLCLLFVTRRRQWFKRKFAKQLKAATTIQKMVRGRIIGMRKYRKRFVEWQAWQAQLARCANIIQRIHRGKVGRVLYMLRKREHKRNMAAAIKIQKVFRGCIVPPWQEIRMRFARKHIRERADKLHSIAYEAVNRRIELRDMGLGRDSASEDEDLHAMGVFIEDDEDDDWQEHFDTELRMPFYFSPSRNERTFTPYAPDSFDTFLVERFVKVQDPFTRHWRTGFVSRFNKKKSKHRVEYSEGGGFQENDHEWLHTKECESRVQVYCQKEDSWSMLRQFRLAYSTSMSNSREEVDQLNASIQASLNASTVNESEMLMYASTETGENPVESPDFVDKSQTVQRFFDEDTSHYYLFNHETGETTWET